MWLFWLDNDGFVIPSLGIEDPDQNKIEYPKVEDSKVSKVQVNSEAFLILSNKNLVSLFGLFKTFNLFAVRDLKYLCLVL